jgi:hypothetical protein
MRSIVCHPVRAQCIDAAATGDRRDTRAEDAVRGESNVVFWACSCFILFVLFLLLNKLIVQLSLLASNEMICL